MGGFLIPPWITLGPLTGNCKTSKTLQMKAALICYSVRKGHSNGKDS
jgi:hypothetical protein